MTGCLTYQDVQEALTNKWHPGCSPTLRNLIIVFSMEGGLEIFAVVDGRGGEECVVENCTLLTVTENASFAKAFDGKRIGDTVEISDTTYLFAGNDAQALPDQSECIAALGLDQALRQSVHNMASRFDRLVSILRKQQDRLEQDWDTVRKAKQYRIYLFEQDRWLAGECQEQKRLEERLDALHNDYQSRRICCLRVCYEQELARLDALELEIEAGVKREEERQGPLRRRRQNVLLIEEQAHHKQMCQRIERTERLEKQKHQEALQEAERLFNLREAERLFGKPAPQISKVLPNCVSKSQAAFQANPLPQEKQMASQAPQATGQRDNGTDKELQTPKPETQCLKVCPECGVYVMQDKWDAHQQRKHGLMPTSQCHASPQKPSIKSNFAIKTTEAEDIRYTSDPYDGSKGLGFLEREEGRFGSFPGHDDYGDEAVP